MSSQNQPGSSGLQGHVTDGYAAIDFGSTSTRAYLKTSNRKKEPLKGYRVQKTGVDDDKKKRFLRGEWPSKGCPFDYPYPVGYDAAGPEHADKRDRSLKSFVWFLADDDDKHPYTRDLKDYHNSLSGAQEKQEFRERLKSMLVRHLAIVAEQIRREAVLREITIRSLVLCVPNAWDKPNFQDVLRPIMDEVAETIARGLETYCVFESEALAQYILHDESYVLKDRDFVLVCDFGGHFMGGSLFQFCRDSANDNQPAFFSLPHGNFGIRGGSQLWEDHALPYIDAYVESKGLPAERATVLRARLLLMFFIDKGDVNETWYESGQHLHLRTSITDRFPDDTTTYYVLIKPADVKQTWELAFREAIDLAIKKVRSLPAPQSDRTLVILSGGSMQNYHARAEVKQACETLGISCKVVGFDLSVESSKWSVCQGAATSEACAKSPKQFFQLGAAIAVQTYTRAGDHETQAGLLFNHGQQKELRLSGLHSTGQLERFEYTSRQEVEIHLGRRAQKKFKLVCDPMYERHPLQYPKGFITIESGGTAAHNSCYDIWEVSTHFEARRTDGSIVATQIPDGRWFIQVDSVEYHENGLDANLHLHLKREKTRAGKKNLRTRPHYTFDLPLTSCGSSNIVQLDHDRIRDRLWKFQRAETKLPQSVSGQESAGEDEPVAKRNRTALSPPEEPYHSGYQLAGMDLPAESQRSENEFFAVDSPEAPGLAMSFQTVVNSQPMAGTRLATSRLDEFEDDSYIRGKTPTSSTESLRSLKREISPKARPQMQAHACISDMRNTWNRTDYDSESSESIAAMPYSPDSFSADFRSRPF
ncbi:hypothetical protein KVR01_007672 [Diaporthe batatas]|uniref:uncharacterized protein n=1 Tax=Diaporthe batatas TaxID=748121 RepID=UPI001D03EBB4|nr:uncharacterized protein KVR01_007672 [Diaporthe batatas]KAG8161907.1 hypothetical protein KVR01_007672 [Diaporthe batatas]